MNVKIKLSSGGKAPVFKHEGDVCADCYANLENDLYIPSGKRELVSLGFAIGLPKEYEAVIRPRSGLTSKGIEIGIGTIDEGYRGEVKACVINNSGETFVVHNEDRICQIAIRKAPLVDFEIVDELSETERGDKGFGSSGV